MNVFISAMIYRFNDINSLINSIDGGTVFKSGDTILISHIGSETIYSKTTDAGI
jgi:hypothetical protein